MSCRRMPEVPGTLECRGIRATLPVYLDDNGGHVVALVALEPFADVVKEGGDDLARHLVEVRPDDLERPTNAEGRASGSHCVDDAIGQQEDEVAGLQRDRGAVAKVA